MKILSNKRFKELEDKERDNRQLMEQIERARREISKFKKANEGSCVSGEYCKACSHFIETGSFYSNGVKCQTMGSCVFNVSCPKFGRKE